MYRHPKRPDDSVPPTEDTIVACIVEFVEQGIIAAGSQFDPSFDFDAACTLWNTLYGTPAKNCLKAKNGQFWRDEWKTVKLVVTVQGRFAVQVAAEAGHNYVRKEDFDKGGVFARDCCQQVFAGPHVVACWCVDC